MSGSTPIFVLVRHGETEWSREGKHTGLSDIPLDERGRAQALDLGSALEPWKDAQVWVSPSSRARETCALAGFSAHEVVNGDLHEWDYGVYDGKTTEEIQRDIPGWNVWTHPIIDGESLHEFANRVDRVLREMREQRQTTIVFAHGHFIDMLTARWLKLEPELAKGFFADPASISLIGRYREYPTLFRWNSTSHLTAG